jgi:hypothetical protein
MFMFLPIILGSVFIGVKVRLLTIVCDDVLTAVVIPDDLVPKADRAALNATLSSLGNQAV